VTVGLEGGYCATTVKPSPCATVKCLRGFVCNEIKLSCLFGRCIYIGVCLPVPRGLYISLLITVPYLTQIVYEGLLSLFPKSATCSMPIIWCVYVHILCVVETEFVKQVKLVNGELTPVYWESVQTFGFVCPQQQVCARQN
jgi:hypothetical protein